MTHLLLGLVVALLPVVGPVRGAATFYCSDGRDGSPVSDCTRGYGPDDHVAAIDRRDTPYGIGDRITVHGPSGAVTVRIVDVCACKGSRVIDLPIGVFETVAGDWRRGTVPVTLTGPGRRTTKVGDTPAKPVPTLPPTDTGPAPDQTPESFGWMMKVRG